MASIGTTYPTAHTTSTTTGSTTISSSTQSLGNQQTFLQLLVAQLQNQDPTQPMEGTTFVTQLATFSDLQANLTSAGDLDAIVKQYVPTSSAKSTGKTS